jgi:hypothetical protein
LTGWSAPVCARAQHHDGGSSRQDLLARDLRFQRSKLAYLAKWHGPQAARLLAAYLALEYLARGAEESLKLALGSRPPDRVARLRLIGGFLRQAPGLRW